MHAWERREALLMGSEHARVGTPGGLLRTNHTDVTVRRDSICRAGEGGLLLVESEGQTP